MGVVKIEEIRRAYSAPLHQGDRADAVSHARRCARSCGGHQTEVQIRGAGVQPLPKLGDWVEVLTEILEKKPSCRSGNAARPSGCLAELRGRGYDAAPTTACIGS